MANVTMFRSEETSAILTLRILNANAKVKSDDPKTQVGCLVVDEHNVSYEGYNVYAPNVKEIRSNLMHAEQDALCKARGRKVIGAIVTKFPCVCCARSLVLHQIKTLYTIKADPNRRWYDSQMEAKALLEKYNVRVIEFDESVLETHYDK